jgi:hypothetical protein
MKKKENILYGIGTMAIIALCVWFYYGYVYPRLPEDFEIPTSYMSGNYRDLDSLAICNGQVDSISCFSYTLPETYQFGYDLIMANRYRDMRYSYYFFEKLICLTKEKEWDYFYFDSDINDALEKMDDSLRVIALRQLANCDSDDREGAEDSVRIGKYASLYDNIYKQEHKRMKGGNNE